MRCFQSPMAVDNSIECNRLMNPSAKNVFLRKLLATHYARAWMCIQEERWVVGYYFVRQECEKESWQCLSLMWEHIVCWMISTFSLHFPPTECTTNFCGPKQKPLSSNFTLQEIFKQCLPAMWAALAMFIYIELSMSTYQVSTHWLHRDSYSTSSLSSVCSMFQECWKCLVCM